MPAAGRAHPSHRCRRPPRASNEPSDRSPIRQQLGEPSDRSPIPASNSGEPSDRSRNCPPAARRNPLTVPFGSKRPFDPPSTVPSAPAGILANPPTVPPNRHGFWGTLPPFPRIATGFAEPSDRSPELPRVLENPPTVPLPRAPRVVRGLREGCRPPHRTRRGAGMSPAPPPERRDSETHESSRRRGMRHRAQRGPGPHARSSRRRPFQPGS